MRVLSLFSGIGAHDLGLEWAGFKIVGQVEIDDYCQKVLKKHWPKVPKFRDICGLSAKHIRRRCGHIDLITGGFPCQDISTAGKQAGLSEGQRSSLWWEMWRLIRDLRPNWLLLENVPALRVKGSDNVLSSLEAIDYTCWPLVVGAVHVGAPHERKRVWIVGYCPQPRNGRLAARSKGRNLADSHRTSNTHLANANSLFGGTAPNERECALVATVSIEQKSESDGISLGNPEGEGCKEGGGVR
jgi:DNA (cytosine-5)-methyltransferase 1